MKQLRRGILSIIFNRKKRSKQTLLYCLMSLFANVCLQAQDLGNGFFDHGVACPISNDRGIVATVDGSNRNVVLLWLFDHRGGYAALMIDAETGKSEQFPMPFTPGDAPYASLLSSKNKFYTLFNNHFAEFDPVKRAFTFSKETLPQAAMGITEDDNGIIWAVTYPNSGLVSFNPITKECKDYGYQYKQNWNQYPKFLAADDKGWLYFALGNTASQIVAFDPVTNTSKPLLEESERKRGMAWIYRDKDGKVYGQALQGKDEIWYCMYDGKRTIAANHIPDPLPVITGTQNLFHRNFADGTVIKNLDLKERKLTVENIKTKAEHTVAFDYSSDGAIVMGLAATATNMIAGGTAFPMRFFSFDPKTTVMSNRSAFGQFNALARNGDLFYFGSYPQGSLLEWNTSQNWTGTKKESPSNPQLIGESLIYTHRPHRILACPDGKTVILSGTPEYGYTGGGLVFYNRETKTSVVLNDTAIITDQSTMSMVALPGNKFAGGTTTMPGTGGEKKAATAELYIMDIASHKVEWRQPLLKGVQHFSDMQIAPDGLVYGIADLKTFFVFDPVKKIIVHQEETETKFGKTVSEQSPRIFVKGPQDELYILFAKGIVKVEPGTFKLKLIAASPIPVNGGGDYLDGRIYFVSGSHICSYQLYP